MPFSVYHSVFFDERGVAQQLRLLGIIKSNAITMGKLIDDLLEFSRTGRKEVRHSKVDMAVMADQILEELTRDTPERMAQVKVAEDLPTATCDPQLIRHVWTNLLSNALKYSAKRDRPEIEVWAENEPHRTVYHVRDNGAGFDMQYADKLFGVFQRLHSKKEFDGTGVGLAIVHRIIGKHGGTVWADAELDKEATFHFSLPIEIEKHISEPSELTFEENEK